MLPIRVGDEVYRLSENSADELVGRVPGEPIAATLGAKLRAALGTGEAAVLDRGELALLGSTIESWATEVGVDAGDVQELREAIADAIG